MVKQILYLGLDPTHYRQEGEIAHYPIIRIVPRPISDAALSSALSNFRAYTHVIATSKSAVKILIDYLPLFDYSMQDWIDKSTLAVGQATARALQAAGVFPWIIAKEETAEGVAHEIQRQTFSSPPFFFWPHSSLSRPVISACLEQSPWQWKECLLYDTKPLLLQPAPDLARFDEIVFTSPSTVDAFLDLFGSLPSVPILTAIGPITRRYMERIKKEEIVDRQSTSTIFDTPFLA